MSNVNEIRKKYLQNPPEGLTKELIENMNDEDLLDMEYFINEDIFDESPLGFDSHTLNTMETTQVKCSKCKRVEYIPVKALDNLASDFPNIEPSVPCPHCFGSMLPVNYTDPKQ